MVTNKLLSSNVYGIEILNFKKKKKVNKYFH
jgi:hypothetical protein